MGIGSCPPKYMAVAPQGPWAFRSVAPEYLMAFAPCGTRVPADQMPTVGDFPKRWAVSSPASLSMRSAARRAPITRADNNFLMTIQFEWIGT
jgi:hypothetical protein